MISRVIRIILVNPSHPGNIGAAARAMKTMGLQQLYLVAPKDFPNPEAVVRAAGADDILRQAQICPDLAQALLGCHLAVGTSARRRTISWPSLSPRAAATKLVAASEQGEVALVFGRERTGLTNEELDQCQALVTIPTDESFSSLNLAAAVQILSYELRLAQLQAEDATTQQDTADPPATYEEVQGFYQHLEEVMVQLEFLNPQHPRKLMRRLYRLFNRAALQQREVNILRGILTAVQQQRGRS